jgi:antitermination protein nusB
MQAIYAMQQNQNQDLDKELKALQTSANQMQDLYWLWCSLFTQLHLLATQQYEVAQKKYLASSDDKRQHEKIKENLLLTAIATNTPLQEAIEEAGMNLFDTQDEFVRNTYKNLIESEIFRKYLSEKQSFATDKRFILDCFEELLAPNDSFYDYIEDHHLCWADDYPLVNSFISKLFSSLPPDAPEKYLLPELYKNAEEQTFLTDLFKKAVLHDAKLATYVDDKLTNWDKERIAVLDNILLKMAICEFLYFPSIPIKVTINEYLELSKEYSTAKSSLFINGVLNVVHKQLEEQELIKKVGRGLL